jgi:hypothetical protein
MPESIQPGKISRDRSTDRGTARLSKGEIRSGL